MYVINYSVCNVMCTICPYHLASSQRRTSAIPVGSRCERGECERGDVRVRSACKKKQKKNMVGVSMVLAEYHQSTLKWQITHIFIITMFEFDGILLKPCLLQPCFHVAGS